MKKKGEAFWVKQPATEVLRGGSHVCSRNQKQPLVTGVFERGVRRLEKGGGATLLVSDQVKDFSP